MGKRNRLRATRFNEVNVTYTPLDRFQDALRGRPQDRPPIFPMNAGWAAIHFGQSPPAEMARRPELVVEAQIRAQEALGYDCLWAYADPLYIPEAFGCRVRLLDTGAVVDALPWSMEDLESPAELPLPDPRLDGRLPLIIDVVRGLARHAAESIPVIGLFEGPFTTAARILEADIIMRLVLKKPEILDILLD